MSIIIIVMLYNVYLNTITDAVTEQHYIASLFCFEVSPTVSRIHFVVTGNTNIHKKVRAFLKRVRINRFHYSGCGSRVQKEACSLGTILSLGI